jgi:tetratricopeptide (TPR) repeat protein
MNLCCALTLTSCVFVLGLATAAPLPLAKEPESGLESLIRDLAADEFGIREAATQKILLLGEPALPRLEQVEYGTDPEQAFRARELIRKIELSIAADTDPAIVELVERYLKANTADKMTLLNVMRQKRAWRQILKLFAREKNAEVTSRYKDWAGQVAVIAARESLGKGDPKTAREFLEMAPADRSGLLALADFHRSQGTWDEELKRAKALQGPKAEAWQLALYRAAAKIDESRDAAIAAGESKIAAAMALLAGDPIPWMKEAPMAEGRQIFRPYTDLAIRNWLGEPLSEEDLEPLLVAAESPQMAERQNGISALFLLGKPQLAEETYARDSPLSAFAYFESLQRIPEAYRCLGLDPENPDYDAWVAKRFSKMMDEKIEAGEDSTEIQEINVLACFLELRGEIDICDAIFRKPLAALADHDPKKFTTIIRLLFNGVSVEGGAPRIAMNAASDWAGKDEERWDHVIREGFYEQDEVVEIWNWMAELDPAATPAERFYGFVALFNFHRDPDRVAERWLAKGWQQVEQTPENERDPLLMRLHFLSRVKPDVANNLRVWKLLSKRKRDELPSALHIQDLAASERWDEAADYFLGEIAQISKSKLDPVPSMHAYAASALRRAGRDKDAAQHDQLADKLALGHESADIAVGYEYGGDYTRAAAWWERALLLSDPGSDDFGNALEQHGINLLEQQQWQKAAAVSEIQAQMAAMVNTGVGQAGARLRLRMSADFARAMANLKQDREGSIALLEESYQLFPTDGSLADHFFPALLQAGLTRECQSWFQQSWDTLRGIIEKYPDSDNLYNTTAWLASRAGKNLDQAEKFLQKALVLNPDQPAYLDTMAEIHLAKGNPAKALDWSRRAMNFMPMDSQIRRQFERFRTAALAPRERR